MLHDASTGFEDIKPLPFFEASTDPINYIWLVAILISIFIAIYFLLRKKPSTTAVKNFKPSEQVATEKLDEILKKISHEEITARDFSNELSLTLRKYIEDNFNFPAAELTPKEIKLTFPKHWKKTLPALHSKHLKQVEGELEQIFYTCKWISFAKDSEDTYEETTFKDLANKSKALIRKIAKYLREEEDRTSGVIAKSNLA